MIMRVKVSEDDMSRLLYGSKQVQDTFQRER